MTAADLSNADLSRADLNGARLRRANLTQADLNCADLSHSDLVNANLTCANFADAALIGANLTSATMAEARFFGTQCGDTTWARSSLLEPRGLDEIVHTTSSSLATNALAMSHGRLSSKFLKGCGLTDWEIENAKLYDPDLSDGELSEIHYRVFELRMRGPIQISPVFISYTHADASFVDKLGSKLDEKGVRFWRDIKDATAGRLDKVIDRSISANPTLLLVLSEHSIKSPWVKFEVERAIELAGELERDVLCPIALDGAWLESDGLSGKLRAQIKDFNVLDFGSHADDKVFEVQFQKLIDGLGLHYRSPAGASKRP